MHVFVRNLLAFIAGIFVGSVVNLAIISVGPALIPLPEGVDLSDMDRFAENLKRLAPENFIAPSLAHAMGTLAGSIVAACLSVKHSLKMTLAIAAFFEMGGIVMVTTYGGPSWFVVADLVGAYFPMGILAYLLHLRFCRTLPNPSLTSRFPGPN